MAAVSFLSITQNIGSIDCSHIKNEITDDVRTKTDQFLRSLSQFIQAAAKAKRAVSVESTTTLQGGSDGNAASSSRAKVEQQVKSSIAEVGGEKLATVDDSTVDIVVLHLQEIGGKKHNLLFNDFLGQAIAKTVMPEAGWCSGLLMQPQNCDCTFTAMGVVIFLSKRVVPISSLLSVRHRTYVAIADDPITYAGGNSSLFFGGKFSNAEKSRKGFLLTSLRIGATCINFVNLHLYHDADNSTAVAESPSRYAPRRVEAFLEAMAEVVPVIDANDPLFVFGDFNTRLDAKRLVAHLTRRFGLEEGAIKMGKKEVTAPDSVWSYFASRDTRSELQQFDLEPRMLMDALAEQSGIELCELPVQFPPSYMLDDHKATGTDSESECFAKRKIRPYKRERLPAWCDRLFMNVAALELMTGEAAAVAKKKIRKQNEGSVARRSHISTDSVGFVEAQGQGACVPGVVAQCVYESVSLECMDHEAVFLLF